MRICPNFWGKHCQRMNIHFRYMCKPYHIFTYISIFRVSTKPDVATVDPIFITGRNGNEF